MDNINSQNLLGQTALMVAIIKKSPSVYEILDNHNDNLNLDIRDIYGNTALMSALKNDNDKDIKFSTIVINKLLEKKFDINIRNNKDQTVLMIALSNKKVDQSIINKLLDKSPDANLQDDEGNTILMIALKRIHSKYKEIISSPYLDKILNNEKLKINKQNVNGMTAFMSSLKMNIDKSIINKIIKKKPDVNLKDYNENTVLYYALNNLEKDNLTSYDKYKNSCELNSFREWCSIVSRIIKSIDLNLQDRYGNTPLMLLLHFNAPDSLINYVLDKYEDEANHKKLLDINIRDKDGNNALIIVICKLCELSNDNKSKLNKIIHRILELNCDINIQNNDGNNAVMITMREFIGDNIIHNIYINEILNKMAKLNLSVNIQNKYGETPLMLSLNVYNQSKITQKILNHEDLDINMVDDHHRNILMRLLKVYNGEHAEYYIEYILKKNININQKDRWGNSALYYAMIREWPVYIINLIMKKNPSDINFSNKIKYDIWVNKWVIKGDEKNYLNLDTDIETEMKKNNKKNTTISSGMIIYRGLAWNSKNIKDKLSYIISDISKLKKDEYINIKFKDLNSWTTDYNIAERFSNDKFKMILSMKVDKEDILLDNFNRLEKEVIIKPGKYKCKIEYTNITPDINKEISID